MSTGSNWRTSSTAGAAPPRGNQLGLASPGRRGEQPEVDGMIRGRERRARRADVEAAAVRQVVAAPGDDAAQPAQRRDVGLGVTVYDDQVGVIARGEVTGDGPEAKRGGGLGGGHREHF